MKKKKLILKILKIERAIFLPVLIAAIVTVCFDFYSRPGILDVNALSVTDKSADAVTLEWKPVRNAETYKVSYKEKGSDEWTTVEVDGSETSTDITDLTEGTEYEFTLQADSEERKGFSTSETSTATKKHQTITGKRKQMKLAGSDDLKLDAETEIELKPEDESVAEVDGDSVKLNPGTTTITAEAVETDEYVSDETEIEVEVLDSVSEDTKNAKSHILYELDVDNCELVMKVEGADGASVPQSFDIQNGDFLIAYGMDEPQRIVRYSADGDKSVYEPGEDLGHPNGFALKDGTGYSVRGYSTKCVVCGLEDGRYSSFNLKYGASGIAYDKARDMFYTSSISTLVSYNSDFELQDAMPVIHRSGTWYNQDCGAHAGIMMRCLSGKDKHGVNYVDLYDMINGKYLGSAKCDLSEVESAAVGEDGFMYLLCNTEKSTDYIYKTPINISDLGADLDGADDAESAENSKDSKAE